MATKESSSAIQVSGTGQSMAHLFRLVSEVAGGIETKTRVSIDAERIIQDATQDTRLDVTVAGRHLVASTLEKVQVYAPPVADEPSAPNMAGREPVYSYVGRLDSDPQAQVSLLVVSGGIDLVIVGGQSEPDLFLTKWVPDSSERDDPALRPPDSAESSDEDHWVVLPGSAFDLVPAQACTQYTYPSMLLVGEQTFANRYNYDWTLAAWHLFNVFKAIYEREVCFRVNVVAIAGPVSYGRVPCAEELEAFQWTFEPNPLLTSPIMISDPNNPGPYPSRDFAVLIAGHVLSDGYTGMVGGCAYQNGCCYGDAQTQNIGYVVNWRYLNQASYAVIAINSQTDNSHTHKIFMAHEVGHLYSAQHTDCNPCTIMSAPYSASAQDKFDFFNHQQITGWAKSHGTSNGRA